MVVPNGLQLLPGFSIASGEFKVDILWRVSRTWDLRAVEPAHVAPAVTSFHIRPQPHEHVLHLLRNTSQLLQRTDNHSHSQPFCNTCKTLDFPSGGDAVLQAAHDSRILSDKHALSEGAVFLHGRIVVPFA